MTINVRKQQRSCKYIRLFILYCAQFALTLLREVRLRFGNKNESLLAFYFVLRSPCTNSASRS